MNITDLHNQGDHAQCVLDAAAKIQPGELIRWRIGTEEFVGFMGSRGPNLSNCITATGESFPVVNVDISRR